MEFRHVAAGVSICQYVVLILRNQADEPTDRDNGTKSIRIMRVSFILLLHGFFFTKTVPRKRKMLKKRRMNVDATSSHRRSYKVS